MEVERLRPGRTVERLIEGMWFSAVVERADCKEQSLILKYIDDGNIEEDVPFDEVRIAECKLRSNNDPGEEKSRKSTVPKPLAGFIEDDEESRNGQMPTVVIHSSADTENAIIINGAQSKLAVGGGLKALRYLKR